MASRENPYRWDGQSLAPEAEWVQPELLEPVAEQLRRGGSVVLLGGRGMGKSVRVRQLERHLASVPGLAVVVPEPPSTRSLEGALGELARALGVQVPPGCTSPRSWELVEQLLYKRQEVEAVVLLLDDVDAYFVGEGGAPGSLGRQWLEHLEVARRRVGRLGVLAAGGAGLYLLRHRLGSSFLSRAALERLRPLTLEQVEALARPFDEDFRLMDPGTLEAVYEGSGGNPALAAYALEQLWEAPQRSIEVVRQAYAAFERRHREFLRSALQFLGLEELGRGPAQVLEWVRRGEGEVERRLLVEAVGRTGGTALDVEDVLGLLESAGLVRLHGEAHADPVRVELVSGVLGRAVAELAGG